MFWWANLSLRIAGKDALAQAGEDGSFDSPGFVKAGDELKRLIDMQPFQKGFLAAPWDGAGGEAAQIGTGKAAMSLMGQWAPSTYAANAKDADEVLGDLGWFPFPTVDGGAGAATEQFGGGDGFAIGKDAPPEAVDFVKFLVDQRRRQQGRRERRHPAGQEGHGVVRDRPEHEVRARRPRAGRRSSSSTSIRPTRRPSARRSTTRCRSCSRARPRRRTSPARSRMPPRPDSAAGRRGPPRRRPPGTPRACPAAAGPPIALFLAPALVLYGLLVIAPVLQAIYYSGFKWNGLSRPRRLRRARELPARLQRRRVHGRAVAQRRLRRPLARAAAAVRARRRADAQHSASRAGRSCASCTSRRSCSRRWSPASSSR